MSLIPMLIVEHLHQTQPVDYAESYGLGALDSDVFRKHVMSNFNVSWHTSRHLASLPKQWQQQRIGTVVSHHLRCGLNYLWLEAIHAGLALVHNSKFLPDGCGYYYPDDAKATKAMCPSATLNGLLAAF